MSIPIIATYVGPIAHLKGERALIRNQPSRAWLGAPERILSRSVFAQFNSMTAQMRPNAKGRAHHRHLGFSWQRFDVRDFKLDEGIITEVERTCEVCPSQFEGRLFDGSHFYARYRGARVRIGLHPHSRVGAIDKGINKVPHLSHTRTTVNRHDGYMTWEEIEPFFIKAIAAYRPDDWRDHVIAGRAV